MSMKLHSTHWLERVGKPFAPRVRVHKATHEQRAADALEYIAATHVAIQRSSRSSRT